MTPIEFCLVLNVNDINVLNTGTVKMYAAERSVKLSGDPAVRNSVELFFKRKPAEERAMQLAQRTPTETFAVLQTVAFFETTTPDVLQKEFNSSGEFVLKEKAK